MAIFQSKVFWTASKSLKFVPGILESTGAYSYPPFDGSEASCRVSGSESFGVSAEVSKLMQTSLGKLGVAGSEKNRFFHAF